MQSPLQIDLRTLPADGSDISGQVPTAFFALDEKDVIQVASPLHYELHIERDGDELAVSGSLEVIFSLECGRCLERYEQKVCLPHYRVEIEITKDGMIDLTDTIREDTLIALPSYPRCEDGNVRPRQCPAEGRFEPKLETAGEESQTAGQGVWEALNKLN